MSQESFIVTSFFLFLGSSSSVLPAARDYPYPRQQEAKHSLFHRGVGACGTDKTQQTALGTDLPHLRKRQLCSCRCFWPAPVLGIEGLQCFCCLLTTNKLKSKGKNLHS